MIIINNEILYDMVKCASNEFNSFPMTEKNKMINNTIVHVFWFSTFVSCN